MKNKIDSNFAIAILALVAACVGFAFWFLGASDDFKDNSIPQVVTTVEKDVKKGDKVIEDVGVPQVNGNPLEEVLDEALTSDGTVLVEDTVLPSTMNIENWLTYTDEQHGFRIKHPQGWDAISNGDSVFFGPPESKFGGYVWGIDLVSYSNLQEAYKDQGKQFSDRKIRNQSVKVGDGIDGNLITVTTDQWDNWISKKVYFEFNEQQFSIGNGAIDDPQFDAFYGSFEPIR